MNMRNELKDLVSRDAVKFGKFTLASGRESDIYVDMRKVTLNPKGAFLIGSLIHEIIKDKDIDAIGGLTMGADPIATAASLVSYQQGKDVKAFLVRKEKKDHGMKNAVEGPVLTGQKVVIVDDVITTGGSTITAIENARAMGLEVVMVIAVFDRLEGGRANIEALVPDVRSLLTRSDIQ